MPTMHDYLVEQQKFATKKLSDLLENQSVYNFKWKFADSLAEVMAIQHMIEHKNYGDRRYKDETYADSAIQSNMQTLINDRKKLLSDGTQLALRYNKDALINMVTNEKGEVDSPEKIKDRFLKQTGRTDILTEDELRPNYYWLGEAQRQARLDWEAAFSKEEISPDDARFQLATSLALQKILGGRKASQKAVKEALEKRRKEILQDPVFQKAIEGKNGAQIAAICGKYDPESKQFTSFAGEELDQAYAGAIAGSLIPAQLDRLREDFTKEPYNFGNVRTHLAQALALDRVQRGLLKTRPPEDIEKWGDVDKLRGEFFKDRAFNRIMKMDKEALGALCGTVDPNTKEFKPFAIEDIRNNLRPVYEKYREQRKQEKAAKKAKLKEEAEKKAAEEAKLKEAQEKAEREQVEQQAEQQQVDLTPHMAWRMMYGDEQQAEQQQVEEQPKPFDTVAEIEMWQRHWTSELEHVLTGSEYNYNYYSVLKPLTYLAALQEMKKTGYVGEDEKDVESKSDKEAITMQRSQDYVKFTLKSKSDMAKLLGKTENGEYQLYSAEQVAQIFMDGVAKLKKDRELRAEEEYIPQAPEEQAPEQEAQKKAEPAPEQKAEPTLSDEAVSKLGVEDVARELYNELGKLGGELNKAYNGKWLNETEDTQYAFDDVMNKKDPKQLEDAIKKAEEFLNIDLGDGKTVGDFGRENKLRGNFDKLMKRAGEIANPELEAEKKTAASWIEGYKADLANRIRGNQRGDDYPAADIARIMAARELSNSVRGKKSTLGVSMNEQQISERAAKIMDNDTFKEFAKKLKVPENLRKVEAVFTKKFSHGGELDDMFRDYLTKRPAGELENDPDLKRWMPTVKQRVEFLQSEAAKAQKENKDVYKEAAEILLLRQAAEVKRGGKGLEANVPVIGEKGVTSLQASVKNYTNDAKFKEAFDQPDVKKYILSGHGGEMAERYNKQPEAKKIEQKQQNGQEKGV